ncbi:MAG: HAMP domain-containing histidine kinase, partial [Nitrospiraceae bacterium]
IDDFDDFVRGTEEDHIYWVMASVEGSYQDGAWNMQLLTDALHWGMMLGLETHVLDQSGIDLLSSTDVYAEMNSTMRSRMKSLLKLPHGEGEFTWYPLYVEGQEIGELHVRPLEKLGLIPGRQEMFRKRGREFLLISFLIAGGGALFLSLLITNYLSKPIRRLTDSAEMIARGDFSVHVQPVHRKYRDEIDRLTEAFNYMVEALRREDALRKHLTSNVAHELRTPLTVIKGSLEAMEDGILSDSPAAIRSISAEIERIISLIEGIEDITSAEASFFRKGTREELNLREFVETVAEGMRSIIVEKNLYLNVEGPPLTVKTYPDKLHIIVKNLLSNSYKFTDAGGITVRWDRTGRGPDEGFSITVEDTGRGMDQAELSLIFDRFYKGDHSDGKGLGLAIVKELSEVIGGKMQVDSVQGRGTKFTISF